MNLDRYAEPAANHRLDRVDQVGFIVTFDPVAKKRIGNANHQYVTLAVKSEPDFSAEPKGEPCGTDAIREGRPKRFLENRRAASPGNALG